ncbi:MAG TPA: FAD:protein FMN transferase [Holophagaceae bacterium]|nr:FAD:protein FMN transferase [Holophagaceae bacterium]
MNPFLLASLVPALVAAAPRQAPVRPGPDREVLSLDREVLSMGTRLRVSLPEGGGAAVDPALAEAGRLEAACSTWDPVSAWSRLNAQGEADLDPEWAALLSAAKGWSERTGGAFDPALGRLIEAWGLRHGGTTPDEATLRAAREASGAAKLEIRGNHVRLAQGAWIEEGGFLKGYALDRMRSKLVAAGAKRGLLDFGGQLLAWGHSMPVSVADPRERERPRLTFRLRDASLSCSGTSERGRHILDPATGRPCEAWGSVAVVMPSGFDADCLSTALYVMGPDRGLAWAEAHGAAAAFLPNDGAPRLSTAFKALHPSESR